MTRPAPSRGEQLGQYEIEALIGAGGMAEVYRARHIAIRNEVALKVVELPAGEEQETGETFLHEARTLASLDHPHIVRVIDAGVSGRWAYLAMTLIRGITLKQRLGEARPSVDETLHILRCLAQALDHAHVRGVLHRDVKPGNVLIAGDDVRLGDFGISQALDRSVALNSNAQYMTPLYTSPEEAEGMSGAGITPRSDLYSLAVIAYEMFTGVTPITGDNAVVILKDHVTYVPPPASSHVPTLPATVDDVLARGLAKQPAARYGTAGSFVEALAAAVVDTGYVDTASTDTESVGREPNTAAGRAPGEGARRSWSLRRSSARSPQRHTRNRRWLLASVSAAAVALLAAGTLIWWPSPDPDRGSPALDAPRGPVFYQADFHDNLDASFNDKVGRSSPAARVEIRRGQLELEALTSQGNPGTDLVLSQGASTYVADVAFGVRPGSDVLFCVGLRWAVPGSLANEMCANTRDQWIELAIWDGNSHIPMGPRIPVADMATGRTISTTVLVGSTHYTLWLDGKKVTDLEDTRVPVKATYPGLDVYPRSSGTGGVDVRQVTLSQIAG